MNRRISSITSARVAKFFDDSGLADRQVKARCSGAAVDRYGDVVVQDGIDTRAFEMSPTVLWNHDTSYPIARAIWIGLENGSLTSIAQFPPAGVDGTADRIYGLIKADVPLDVSIGFIPVKSQPIDSGDPWGGTRYLACELLEWSVCSVGAQRDSRIIGKRLAHQGDPAAAERLRYALQLQKRLGRIANPDDHDDRAAASEFDFQIATKIAAAERAHAEFLDRQRRAAAIDAALRFVAW